MDSHGERLRPRHLKGEVNVEGKKKKSNCYRIYLVLKREERNGHDPRQADLMCMGALSDPVPPVQPPINGHVPPPDHPQRHTHERREEKEAPAPGR